MSVFCTLVLFQRTELSFILNEAALWMFHRLVFTKQMQRWLMQVKKEAIKDKKKNKKKVNSPPEKVRQQQVSPLWLSSGQVRWGGRRTVFWIFWPLLDHLVPKTYYCLTPKSPFTSFMLCVYSTLTGRLPKRICTRNILHLSNAWQVFKIEYIFGWRTASLHCFWQLKCRERISLKRPRK